MSNNTKDSMDKKENEASQQRIRWLEWQRQKVEAASREEEWEAYWVRRRKDDDDLWRDKDFANAVDKAARSGYVGKHGSFTVPEELKLELAALFLQVTLGDYACQQAKKTIASIESLEDGNDQLPCAILWEQLRGKSRIDAQRAYIKLTNRIITKYGWNPPEGWK